MARIYSERVIWRKELPTDYVRGVIHGLEESARILHEMHETAKRAQDSSPFVWKAAIIRRMLKQAMAYVVRGERSRGLAIIERVLLKRK